MTDATSIADALRANIDEEDDSAAALTEFGVDGSEPVTRLETATEKPIAAKPRVSEEVDSLRANVEDEDDSTAALTEFVGGVGGSQPVTPLEAAEKKPMSAATSAATAEAKTEEELPSEWKCEACDLFNDYYSLTCQACFVDYSESKPRMKEVCSKTHSKKFATSQRGWHSSVGCVVVDKSTAAENRRRLLKLKRRELLVVDYELHLDQTPFGMALCKQFNEDFLCVVVPESCSGQQGAVNGSQILAIGDWLTNSDNWPHVNTCYKGQGFSYFSQLDKTRYLKNRVAEGQLKEKPIRLIMRFDPMKILTMTHCADGATPCEWWPQLVEKTRKWAMDSVPDVYRVNDDIEGGQLTVWDHLPCEKLDKDKVPKSVHKLAAGELVETWIPAGAFFLVKRPHYGWVKCVNRDGSCNLTLVKRGEVSGKCASAACSSLECKCESAAKSTETDDSEQPSDGACKHCKHKLVPRKLEMVVAHKSEGGDVFGHVTVFKNGSKEAKAKQSEAATADTSETEDVKQTSAAESESRQWLSDCLLRGPGVVNVQYWMCDMSFESSEAMHSLNLTKLQKFAQSNAARVQISVVKVCVMNEVDSDFATSLPSELSALKGSVPICAVSIDALKPWALSNFSRSVFKCAYLTTDASFTIITEPRDELTVERVVWKLTGLLQA